MNELILKALMRLFAIIAKADNQESIGKGLEVVKNFLKQQLNSEQVLQYLELYNNYLEQHHKISDPSAKVKRLSSNSVKVIRICSEINEELMQRQKIIVLIKLIEFINSNEVITEQETQFVDTVSESFNIPNEEYIQLQKFITSNQDQIALVKDTLIIGSNIDYSNQSGYFYHEGLKGKIAVTKIKVSENHADLMYLIRCYGNAELTLNGQVIDGDKVQILNQGSTIRGSKIAPIFYSDIIGKMMNENRRESIVFEVSNIEYHFKSGKKGLHELSFREDSGTLVGIMGGSGAGKSTILNVLNGNEKPTKGKITINGIDIHLDKKQIEGVIGYVSQDDLLIEELTVFENLFYNAKLCFGNLGEEEIKKLVWNILSDLDLTETANLKVGNPLNKTISGGQRKRLNIGLELIREPGVMFVDEPTSGLSSRDSENIMDLLKVLTLKGKLVFVVIHQPSSDIFKMFDKLLILDRGGFPIYYGNPVESLVYFKTKVNHINAIESECITCGNVNPEQVFNIIETKVVDEYGKLTENRRFSPSEWNQYYNTELAKEIKKADSYTKIPESTFKIPSKLKQFYIFIERDIKSKLTNVQYLAVNLLETPILAFVLAFLVRFYSTDVSNTHGYNFMENENIPAYILMGVVIALFVGLSVSAEEIFKDLKILKRESFLNLSRASYLWSKIAVMFIISAIQTITFVLIGNFMLGIKGMYLDYFLILFTTSCFANVLGLNISQSFDKAVTIYILIPFLIIPQLILSGVIVKFEKLNPWVTSQTTVPFVGELMASRWAYEALAVNQFKKNEYQKPLYEYERIMSEAEWRKTYWIPRIKEKINEAIEHRKQNSTSLLENDLLLIKNEFERNNTLIPLQFNDFQLLTSNGFNEESAKKINAFIDDKLLPFYKKKFNFTIKEKDKFIYNRNQSLPKDYNEEEFRMDYENENLNSLLRNTNDFNKIIETDGRLIQRSDPIYHNADKEVFLRAHFFAPTKSIFGNLMDTFWVNMAVIWIMTIILIFTLYYNSLKKLLHMLGSIGGLFSKKK